MSGGHCTPFNSITNHFPIGRSKSPKYSTESVRLRFGCLNFLEKGRTAHYRDRYRRKALKDPSECRGASCSASHPWSNSALLCYPDVVLYRLQEKSRTTAVMALEFSLKKYAKDSRLLVIKQTGVYGQAVFQDPCLVHTVPSTRSRRPDTR